MDLGVKGKAFVVLGASEGMGRAVALRLASEGADLVVAARGEENLAAVAKECSAKGSRVHPVVADVRSFRDLERVFEAAEMEFSRIHGAVTNHGGPAHGRLADLDDDAWRDAFELLVMSAVRATRLAVPIMPDGGSIVHVVSTAAKQPIDNLLLSNALRPAVIGFAKATSLELAPKRVRVNCVLPGLTDTARLHALNAARAAERGTTPEAVAAERAKAVPLGRLAKPEEIADAVAFLLSERAAYVTGQSWVVDGGLVQSLL